MRAGEPLPSPGQGKLREGTRMRSWLEGHFQGVAALAVATAVFAIVTIATGGLGAPLLVALAAGGFASGVAGYATGELLSGRTPRLKDAALQGVLAAALTVATLGVGRVLAPVVGRVLAPLLGRVLPGAKKLIPVIVQAEVTNAAVGATFGSGMKAAENLGRGRPLGEG